VNASRNVLWERLKHSAAASIPTFLDQHPGTRPSRDALPFRSKSKRRRR
jgi:hypothetical protein